MKRQKESQRNMTKEELKKKIDREVSEYWRLVRYYDRLAKTNKRAKANN